MTFRNPPLVPISYLILIPTYLGNVGTRYVCTTRDSARLQRAAVDSGEGATRKDVAVLLLLRFRETCFFRGRREYKNA